MTSEFASRQNDVKKLGPVQIIEILGRVFDLVGRSRAFVNETAHRFRIGGAQAGSFANLIVMVKPRVTNGNEMFAAKRLAVKRCGERLATIRDTALFCIPHISTQGNGNLRNPLWLCVKP